MEELKSNPVLCVLVGPSGSGKSTFAREYVRYHRCVINWISSDNIRKELYGDESVQKDHAKVFDLMFKRTVECLKRGESVIYDATNLSSKRRRHLIKQVRAAVNFYIHIKAIVFNVPFEELIRNDALRNRTVGEVVIRKQIAQFQVPCYEEGFDEIKLAWDPVIGPNDFVESKCYIRHDNPHHSLDVFEHMRAVGDAAFNDDRFTSITAIEAAYLHDIGKAYTKTLRNAHGEPSDVAHYYGHQNWGAYISLTLDLWVTEWGLGRTVMSDKEYDDALLERAFYIQYHMEPFFRQGEAWDKFTATITNEHAEYIQLIHELDMQNA